MSAPDPERDESLAGLYRERLARARAGMRRWTGEVRPDPRHLRSDALAGVPGAVSSVPDGMAAAVLAGVSPAHGLYASFAGPVAGGLTTSTRLMVVTTTSAAALAAGSALDGAHPDERSDAMLWLTLMAGGVMVLAALVGASRLVRFVSYSVMLGFLSGVAVNMVLGQLPDLLGADADGHIAALKALDAVRHLPDADPASACAGLLALGLLVALERTRASVLASLVALAIPTVLLLVAARVDATSAWAASVRSVRDTGTLPHGVPVPGLPDASAFDPSLVVGALAVAVIVLVQGAGVAEAVPNPASVGTSSRRDFTGQGLGNVASGLFGGMPVGGSVGQTALNVTAGARTRWASVWTGAWMLVVLLLLGDVVGRVAMPTLAAVLVYAGWRTVRPREVVAVVRAGPIPAVALTATFLAVLALPVATAVGIGVACSLLLQLNQEALDLRLVRLRRDSDGTLMEEALPARVGAGDVVVVDVYGSLFYAGARTLQRHLPTPSSGSDDGPGPVVVLRLRGRTTLGATFLKVAGDYARRLEDAGGRLYLSGVDPELAADWRRDPRLHEAVDVRVEEATAELGASTRAAIRDASRARRAETVHRVRQRA